MMLKYAVAPRADWIDGTVSEVPGAILCAYGDLYKVVHELTARADVLLLGSVSRRLRENGRVYVAGARGMTNVIIEKVRPITCTCSEPDTEPDIPKGSCGLCGKLLPATGLTNELSGGKL